ncbi:MAG: carbonic anhydrase [Burkholderiaceae bacterium]
MSAKPLPAYLTDRFRAWRTTRFAEDRAWYARLAKAGQNPRTMLIACCDSRVDPIQLFAGEPGDFFVVRNVANLVPPSNPDRRHHGTSAAVEFAVQQLGVAHIVVLGHSGCGGVSACYDMVCTEHGHDHEPVDPAAAQIVADAPAARVDLDAGPAAEQGRISYIGNWLQLLIPAARSLSAKRRNHAEALRELEHQAVRTSLANLMTFDFVAEAVTDGRLTLHGAWIDIADGQLKMLDPLQDRFVSVG